ncbi:hypothetical protein BCR24_15785 [Enterococcus ureilyticus]|uniref:HAD family hydrolase n=1 Tax=Enterococcus ureilyticus TaxID=1131292 RepID=A0A1E5HBT3_9ENTE|nr:HAD-IA family hydrolase [Enterococcus ureilyticus]MBM7690551.1 HAD superfamily hydrolase (TIGR01549 family) [Enterococcus ureilyticus]OEG22404.1 hypothetical protein BCR24_15785 [Enterococcus ureilyticus]
MKNFIWDLDGTILDSYKIILKSLEETCLYFDMDFDYTSVKKHILKKSVVSFLQEKSSEKKVSYSVMKDYFSEMNSYNASSIKLMNGAKEILNWTRLNDIQNYIYTHKSDTAIQILKNLNIDSFFEEVVTSSYGFKRKPDSQALDYLIEKYNLDKQKTYYIGDRLIDKEVAINAGIKSINLTEKNSYNNTYISSLSSIERLF